MGAHRDAFELNFQCWQGAGLWVLTRACDGTAALGGLANISTISVLIHVLDMLLNIVNSLDDLLNLL